MVESLQIVLVRPGATDFDEQGRIKGSLDIPLSKNGAIQVARTAGDLAQISIDTIYASPCQCALQTAAALAEGRNIKVKTLDKLRNLDHGLWHGRRIEEVRQTQPKVYRQWQDHPESLSPPEGESVQSAADRVRSMLAKIVKKHHGGVVALVASEPLASVIRSVIYDCALGDLWKRECECGNWELIEVAPQKA